VRENKRLRDERQMQLVAEAKAEALEKEMSKMRANFSAGIV
jgi:hypothetical protein